MIRCEFTGKERDTESGNDYFGARYYASNMGRWLSPDLPFADQHASNPQSWNLYGYTRNNPLRNVGQNGRGVLEAIASAAANWIASGIVRDGGAKSFASNVGIGLARGAGQLGVALAAGGASKLSPSLGLSVMMSKTAAATMPSNQTQAEAAPVGTALAGAAITGGVGAAESALSGGAEASTMLFRAVGPTDYQGLEDTGQFLSSENANGAMGKGFFYSQEDAAQFSAQQTANGGRPTCVVACSAPTDLVTSSYQQTAATEGPAVFITNENLPQVTPTLPLPPKP